MTIAQAYVLWQVGGTRDDEYEAATMCAAALRRGGTALAPLARNYITAFLAVPYPTRAGAPPALGDLGDLGELARLANQPRAEDETSQFERVIEFDRRVEELDRASATAYLDMLSAHADLQIALARQPRGRASSAAAAARTARTAAAGKLVDAWRAFDGSLASSSALIGDAMALAVLALDDAVLTRARYYAAVPATNGLAPLLSGAPAAPPLSALLRAQIAPLRIAWERRYADLLGPSERDVVAYQETPRFAAFERRAAAFEAAYVAFLVAARTGGAAGPRLLALATEAATRASAMSLYRTAPDGRTAEASNILALARGARRRGAADVLDTIVRNYQVRRLR